MSQFELSAETLGLRSEDLGESLWRSAAAEFIATMLFVFIGCGAVVTASNALSGGTEGAIGASGVSGAALVAISLAHGLAIAVLVTATAKLSGGHINPAVTFAAMLTGRIKAGPGVVYMAAQMVGAVVGAGLLAFVLVDSVEGTLGAQALNDGMLDSTMAGLLVEIILTFVLVFTVFAAAMDPRGLGNLAPIAIGLAVLADHFVGVPLTGASMNPARSFGPAVVAGEWDDFWVFVVGPLIGGAIAGLVYVYGFMNRPEEAA